MVDFTVFRLRDALGEFNAFIDFDEERPVVEYGPYDGNGFSAKLYVSRTNRRRPDWYEFLEPGFPGTLVWNASSTTSAALVVRLPGAQPRSFGFAFGPMGRFLFKDNVYYSRFGLKTALNIISSPDALPMLRSFDTTRHGRNILRSRVQAVSASDINVFELDLLRDLVRDTTGVPADVEQWGKRVGGSDQLRLSGQVPFVNLGQFCELLDIVASADTYRERFPWVENIEPVNDATRRASLEDRVASMLRDQNFDLIQMAPPGLTDWDSLSTFQYHFDTRHRPLMVRQEMSLANYLAGLRVTDPDLDDVTSNRLKNRKVIGLNGDGLEVASWSVWRCLVAEFEHDGETYVLDEGEFYRVAPDFLNRLNEEIVGFTNPVARLPAARTGIGEPAYNAETCVGSMEFLLMDASEIEFTGARGGIELCDILSSNQELIHVKRYSGSQTLSHLFAQARTSAELLLMSSDFRAAVREHIGGRERSEQFAFFRDDLYRSTDFEIVLAIIKRWQGRGIDSLPFFAKVNLRRLLTELTSWGYRVSVLRVPLA